MRTESRTGRNEGQGGFTLIEMLVAIAILGVLASVTVLAVGGITDEASENACKAERRTIETALAGYHNDFQAYPATLSQLASGSPSHLKTAPDTSKWSFTANTDQFTGAGKCLGY